MPRDTTTGIPTVLFGAFDRHNFGDLLFPHVIARMLPGHPLLFAGLADRDLRPYGGHRVVALSRLARTLDERAVNFIHVGGEILACDAWEAAVMLSSPDEVEDVIAAHADWQQDRLAWARDRFGIATLAPYTLARESFPQAARTFYNAVGGVGLGARDAEMRAEVIAHLKATDYVGVRDNKTKAVLEASGLTTKLMPDSAVMVAELFGDEIHQRAAHGAVSEVLKALPHRYIAAQFSADFGDDTTLDEFAAQLDRAAIANGLGVVLFRAGAAPWHDDLTCYQRIAARMRAPSAQLFASLDIWDICALIAHSAAYCGSSLHGRIVAMAFALPRINVCHPRQVSQETKHTAFAATWEEIGVLGSVEVREIADGIGQALTLSQKRLQYTADSLVNRYRDEFSSFQEELS